MIRPVSGLAVSGLLRHARRRSDLLAAAVAYIPIVLILYGDIVRQARLLVLGLLLFGFSYTFVRRSDLRWVWAAPIPIAVWVTWRTLSAPLADPHGLQCADALSPPAAWRLAQALLALGALGVLMGVLRVRPAAIWWRRPAVPVARLSVLGFFVAAPLGLLLSVAIARPYFGTFDLNIGDPLALVPGLVFSLSNAIGEEVIYRGAFMAFAGRVIGLRSALVAQAVVFGVSHAGAHFMGSPIPVVLAVGFGGYVAGLLTLKTRSLMMPIAVHTAIDLPVYVFFACRNPLPL
jgi:membrane protease YdiL (CAAX protease family)